MQVATRYVPATDQEAAAEKIPEQLEKPYGFLREARDVRSEIQVVQKEENMRSNSRTGSRGPHADLVGGCCASHWHQLLPTG